MADISVVKAVRRLDRVAFNPATEYTDHAFEVGVYTCPHCKTLREFHTGTLQQFERAKGLELGPEWNARCEIVRPLGAWEWAMDFRCQGCGRAVRLVYGHDGEYAMSSWKYRALEILEDTAGG